MKARYVRERAALSDRVDELVEVTVMGGPQWFIDTGPSENDYVALARRAYVGGDLTTDEFEAEIERALVGAAT